MQSHNKRRSSRWSLYLVALIFGTVFSFTLVSIAWNNALDNNKREFSLESVSLKNTVFSNVRTAHNALNSLASFFVADRDFSNQEFLVISQDMLQQFPYLEGVIFSPFVPTLREDKVSSKNYSSIAGRFPVFYQVMRGETYFDDNHDLATDKRYQEVMKALGHSDSIITAVIPAKDNMSKDYWMFKLLRDDNPVARNNEQNILGLVAVFVKTNKLLGATLSNSNLSVTMLNDSVSLSGRQLLYDVKSEDEQQGWSVTSLAEDGVTQFPMYSIKLAIGRDVGWSEIEKSLIFITLLIGIGVTLLLVALVRARDLQAKQLRERNAFVERQVEKQTKELALARDEAIEASRVKSEFLAGMSHEIRTPLNAIIGMSELLSETPLSHEQKNYISVFKKAGDTLLSLVNDILDLSKIEANQLVLEDIEFDLLETVEECAEIYALKAADKGVELLSYVHHDVTNLRKGDSARLRQIILNLISNALKFTELGEIVVRVELYPDASGSNKVLFSVSDTGIGIPKEKLEAIFASFTQADSSTTRKYGGTGLGLTISRSLVDMMGGKIWVESEEGEGSVFKFTVNLPVIEDEDKIISSADLKNKKLLIVDDNASRREILSSYLADANAQAICISEKEEISGLLEESISGDTFELLLIDADIAGLNSLELVETMKQQYKNVPSIVMLQAAEINQYMEKLKQVGVDSYLVKPIKKRDLIHKVNDLLFMAEKGEHPSAEAINDELAIKPLKVLLVDDNPDNRLLIKAYLKKLPYSIDEAENGQIAVDKFQENDYDIVLMDVQMPVMDGHEATQTIRAWEKEMGKESTSIIALTAHAFKEEIDKCLASGCDTHLSKPVKKTLLIDTIQEMAS